LGALSRHYYARQEVRHATAGESKRLRDELSL
jgi:hypothetical protein